MPEVILKFNLPEEQAEYDLTLKAGAMSSALFDIVSSIRQRVKYGTADETATAIYSDIWDILNSHGIDPFTT